LTGQGDAFTIRFRRNHQLFKNQRWLFSLSHGYLTEDRRAEPGFELFRLFLRAPFWAAAKNSFAAGLESNNTTFDRLAFVQHFSSAFCMYCSIASPVIRMRR
jgi:hypothetical protein